MRNGHLVALFFLITLATALGCMGCSSSRHSSSNEEDDVVVRTSHQAFDSKESMLVDFTIDDGALITRSADPAVVHAQIQAQLMYTVGALNTDRSLGRFERLTLSDIAIQPQEGAATPGSSYVVRYHAKLPVAWGSLTTPTPPTIYALILPARVGEEDQTAFAAKYGKTCADPAAGVANATRMFLTYRPQRAGCTLDAPDIVTVLAKVSPSTENTQGKYPEYHRIWEDGSLDVVALFSRASYEPAQPAQDDGVQSFEDFHAKVDAYLHQRQPDPAKHSATLSTTTTTRRTNAATLPDGRKVTVDMALVGTQLSQENADLDAWYNALTPRADVILYSGHAGLGDNVRTLMKKGAFVARKYVVWVENGCDTFAYIDRTLIDRRAAVNPDDALGTKYMDTVSTVMGGYFRTGATTTMTFLDAMVSARDPGAVPKTYRDIFGTIDADQVTVVTGEEDNDFTPAMFSTTPPASSCAEGNPNPNPGPGPTPADSPDDVSTPNTAGGDGQSGGNGKGPSPPSCTAAPSSAGANDTPPSDGDGGGCSIIRSRRAQRAWMLIALTSVLFVLRRSRYAHAQARARSRR